MNRLHLTTAPALNNLHFGIIDAPATDMASGDLKLFHVSLSGTVYLHAPVISEFPIPPPGLTCELRAGWRYTLRVRSGWPALAKIKQHWRVPVQPLGGTFPLWRSSWQPLFGASAQWSDAHARLLRYRVTANTDWPTLQSVTMFVGGRWIALTAVSRYSGAEWSALTPVAFSTDAAWPALTAVESRTSAEWLSLSPVIRQWDSEWPDLRNVDRFWRIDLTELVPPSWRWPRSRRWIIPPPPEPQKPRVNALLFSGINVPNTIHFGRRPRFAITPMTHTVVATHSVIVRTLPDQVPLTCSGIEWTASIDTWTDRVRLALHRESDRNLLFDDPDTPTAIEIVIDDVTWRGLALTYSDSMQWGRRGFTVTAESPAALLAAPYADTKTATEADAMTAQQLAAAILSAFPDWTLSWELPDWLIPGGAFSYQDLAPIDAIGLLVKAVGGTLQSHLTEKILRAVPVHPVSPWEWDTATPAVILTRDKILTQDAAQAIRPNYAPYNGIHVSGRDQGILALVRRQGTLGEHQPEMVIDPLITHIDAARERGRAELAGLWPHPDVSVRIPLASHPDTPALVMPGDMVEVRHPDIVWRGQAMSRTLSISSNDGAISARQTVSFSSKNAWAAWRSLQPEQPLQSATVAAIQGASATVELVDGGMMTVRRRASENVGQRVFLRGNEIIGDAPTLPYSILDV